MATETKHVGFNPAYMSVTEACVIEQADGWRLVKVVPIHQYEAVIVFERGQETTSEERGDK